MWRAVWALLAMAWLARAGPGPPLFSATLYNLTLGENTPARTAARPAPPQPQPFVPLPPGARCRFKIRHGDKDRFFKAEERALGDRCFLLLRTRAAHADVLNRERRDRYRLDVRATLTLSTGERLESDVAVDVIVEDTNDLSPLFYPTEYEVSVPEDTPSHSSVARVFAEDADLGINGEIYYSFGEPTDQFAIHPTSGEVTLTRPLVFSERARHELTVLAQDRAGLLAKGHEAPSARARLDVQVTRVNLHSPELKSSAPVDSRAVIAGELYAVILATDRDEEDHGRVASVEIVDGDPDGHFRVSKGTGPGEWDVVVHSLLERGQPRSYNLTLRATDAGRPPRSSYLSLPVRLAALAPPAPVFSREVYEASVPETAPPRTPLVRLKVSERANVYIEIVGGNEGGEFYVNPDTGVLYTAVELDAEKKSLYTLTVSAVDQGDAGARQQSSAKVKVQVLDANDNDPVFENEELEVTVRENEAAGAVVARVTARDADSGENAYISYSIANLQPVPFEVEHFSGVVRTTRLLDYESMRREYVLLLRASDWGLPYRRQAEMRLRVRLLDVNDNRPQFERVDCVGYLPRDLSAGTDVATLSAVDLDAGDAVSYRIIGGNDDNCFSLDSASGILRVSCEPAARGALRVLNVTATDGTHFADATTVTMHAGGGAEPALECRDAGVARALAEVLAAAARSNAAAPDDLPPAPSRYGDNLHAPEFQDFPVEVKVNESVPLGTTLVQLRARDRDLGYNGLLVYVVSAGDDDSAFRIDPDTGDLQVIGYLDREREAEYYLNVTVSDLGRPARAASRLLPVTVLDVNDNAPVFDKPLASFRVTENALNGTAVFSARATDKDAGDFARITYSLRGASGEFCVDRFTGTLLVCAPLDRETRAHYDLAVVAEDGGGLRAEARVRVAIDDVNDNVPHFTLSGYSARVREDVPVGTLVAVLDAADPDLGDGGRVRYSLADPPAEPAFSVDERSGAVRTARPLDYETRQVYGVTVRATDEGRPPLSSEVTLYVEVLDVDENAHSPQFTEPVLAAEVAENATIATVVTTVTARDADPPGRDSRLQYYVAGGSGLGYFSVDDAGVVRTLAPLDRETVPHYWLTVCAEDHGLVPRVACVELYVEVTDVNDNAPWPERAQYSARLPENSTAGTALALVVAWDLDLGAAVKYRIVSGNPDGLFAIDENSGAVTTTGRALSPGRHALEVRATDGHLAAGALLLATVDDVNDHAPVFTQRLYQLRVPLGAAPDDPLSAESEPDEEDEGAGGWDALDDKPPDWLYAGSVLALDADAGDSGRVRYAGRARRPGVGVCASSGRIYVRPAALETAVAALLVRACDGGGRCSVARAAVRAVAAGGGGGPQLEGGALHAAELDAPGYVLGLLQANDPEGDALYYDIVDGDPESQFQVGREDGSLVVARRLLWEQHALYALNVSVTDGSHTAHARVNVTVANDVHEDGLAFSQPEYTVDVSEDARVGEPLLALSVRGGGAERALYGLADARSPASLALFRLDERAGLLTLAKPLDRESASEHALGVWARDGAPRASHARARVLVRVHDADEHAPEWPRRLASARVPATAAAGSLVAALRASDRDSGEHARIEYSLAGGDAAGLFAVSASGEVRLTRAPPPSGEFALSVRAANPPPAARASLLPLHVLIVPPDDAPPQFTESSYVFEVYENEPRGTAVGGVEARAASSVRYELSGARGRLQLNPAAGLLATAAPLDHETTPVLELRVTAWSLGGGRAHAQVLVHVLDRNEFAPRFLHREYGGRVSEAAAPGALVLRADADEPLVLDVEDEDSPAHRRRTFDILDPEAAKAFALEPATGALRLRAPLDFETRPLYEFDVRVVDADDAPQPSDSVARVTVRVLDVDDCAPAFPQAEYSATVLTPAAAGVLVLALNATDPDTLGDRLRYSVAEGAAAGALRVRGSELVVSRGDLLVPGRLRLRVSDGARAGSAWLQLAVRAPDPAGLAFPKADYFSSAVENSTKPATVLVLDVLGAAVNEHVEFSILNPTPQFKIGKTSGALVAAPRLDREERANYVLNVRAAAGAREAVTRVHITVADVNDNCPEFVHQPYLGAVRAGAAAGTVVTRVTAVDRDAGENAALRYEMKRGHGDLFRVDRRTGAVSLRRAPDAAPALHSLRVAAYDGGAAACGAEVDVAVRVWGGGAAPAWPQPHVELSAAEDVPVGAALGDPLRADSPLQRQLIYSLLDAEDHPDLDLHFDTGVLVSAAPLDHEAGARRQLLVRATDGVTGAYADVPVTLALLDVNDCAPEFERDVYRGDVSEAAEPGTLVLAVRAADRDSGDNGRVTYSLQDEGAPFSVDPVSGELRVAAGLDRELKPHYHLRVQARDNGSPALESVAHVMIALRDVNDNAPSAAPSSAPVSTEAPRGTALLAVRARDKDASDAPRLRFALQDAVAARAFSLDAESGVLSLSRPHALSGWRGAALNVSVSDGAHVAYARVKLWPAPVNAHAPRFTHVLHEARALEEQEPPLLITTVKALDEDAGDYGAVTYSIPSARLRETFALDPRSGALSTRVRLDRERRAEWLVPVTASDGGGLLRHSLVRVRVQDVNDHAPAFALPEYATTVAAGAAPGGLLRLRASDADAGAHARLSFELFEREGEAPDAARRLFRLQEDTGELQLLGNITQYAGRAVRLWARVRDGGGRWAAAPLTVRVRSAKTGALTPRAPAGPLFLPEDAAPGTLLAELGVSQPARYRLLAGDRFAVDVAGRLLLAAPLDREEQALHHIGVLVEAEDEALGVVLVEVTLHVLDVNEHAPEFHSQPFVVHLAENAPVGASVLQVLADDLDAGASGDVRYALAEESAAQPFALDPDTGWLVVTRALDRELAPEHRLALLAADGGVPVRRARGQVVVRLVDYNDCPPRFARAQLAAQVREDAPPGTVALLLALEDDDEVASPLSFHVAGGDPAGDFALRPSGELFVARQLDRETRALYELDVIATDGKFSASTHVRVEILDANDHAPYCPRLRYRSRLAEDAALGTDIVVVEAVDDDEPQNARLRFYLTGDGADAFALDKDSGRLTLLAALDREARAHYDLVAHAQDRDRPEWECTSEVIIDVDDINDNTPRFSTERYSVTLPEDAEPGALVVKVHATDADLGLNRLVRYAFAEPVDGFDLSSDTGIITLRTPLDRETAAAHRLLVRAQDRGAPALSATAEVLLTVADVNDNPPEFELTRYSASVHELDAVGTELLRLRATSKDTGVNAEVYYSIVGGDAMEDFAVDRLTGLLTVARPLDYERTRQYTLTVQALDGGAPPLSDRAAVNITVLDCNDNAPVFTQPAYEARVREDTPLGAVVLQLLALDADAGTNGRVHYSLARDAAGLFAVDADTGALTLRAPLDRETSAAHSLAVLARDGGRPALEAAARVLVVVLDANDCPPQFDRANYSAVLREDRPPGHAVLTLSVTDADAPPNGPPYTFDFQSGNEMGAFRLEQDGVLRTAARFNHRIKDRYALQVRVFDNGTPPLYADAWVRVRVVEESQYPPVATPLDVCVVSYRDEYGGGALGRVRATDRDAYDVLEFHLAPPSPLDLFAVDAHSGELSAVPRLDPGRYLLNVTVADGKFTSAVPVQVNVLLVDDEALANALVVRFRAVTPEDFVLSHRKGFLRAVAEAMGGDPADVLLLSVQPSGDEANEVARRRRQVAQDLDVLFAVRAGAGWAAADAVRRRLHAHLEPLEERTRLVVEELVRSACGGCDRGACEERADLLAGEERAVAADVYALVAPIHRLRAACVCEPGYAGDRCDAAERDAPPPPLALFGGDGYALYHLDKGVVNGERLLEDELSLSVRFRTLSPEGTLAWAGGRVDYLVLEVVEGYVQVRMELGSGEAVARAAAPVADGAWHVARLERRGGSARLAVDRHVALAAGPLPAAVLDTPDAHLYVGAALIRHAHANGPLQVTRGFIGCISEVRLSGVPLPLEEGGSSGRAQLVRRDGVRSAPLCADQPPGPCAAHPCLNGGSCVPAGAAAVCRCHPRFDGELCHLDRDPCAARPCLHGGRCEPAPQPPGYVCLCAPPTHGPRCERGRYCAAEDVCGHGGSCEEGVWGPSCRCRGYYGPLCQHDVDECAGEPCAEGATCLNEPGSFRCVCPPGRTGTHCGNPLHSDAVLAAPDPLAALWGWARAAGWPVWAGLAAGLLLLLLAVALLPLLCRRRPPPPPPNNALPPPRPSKLSNLEAVRRERPASCAPEPPPLNNADTLRSYGSAGDELEGIPPDYIRNLNLDPPDRKPWSEQMHLHTFTDNKIYNDLKGEKARALRPADVTLVGGYHWDCSDWCGGALPAISEVPAAERRDSTSPPPPPPLYDTSSGLDDDFDAGAYLVHPDQYLPREDSLPSEGGTLRALRLRPAAGSLLTLLEERDALLGRPPSADLSARLCEIEDSDEEPSGHTAV